MQAFVVGNVTIDETMFVDALPAPGATVLGRTGPRDLGGKGANQAIVLARARLRTTLVAPIGDDARAAAIRQAILPEPVIADLVEIEGVSTDHSLIFRLPDGENAILSTAAAAEGLAPHEVEKRLVHASSGDRLVVQGNLSRETTAAVLAAARRRGMVTAVNPSPVRDYFPSLWPFVDIVCLNRGEALSLTGATGPEAAAHLLARGVGQVVLTAGGEGALLADRDGVCRVPAVAVDVVDTTGAGDTFLSVALASAALRSGRLDRRAIEDAARASAITVARPGTHSAFPSVSELAGILA
ncbi:PfkB family carbohydrate kinase [Ensifer soli]|uniref:PfkB family carbohydrate kinase n=1 Tax=Ciceribacter sp. sgz301302 TaxID=3342379 RepID=UPI0035B8AD3A